MNRKLGEITEGVIWKQLLIFFFPILLGTFFQQMYNMVDTIIVGRAVGTHALAAVGAVGPLVNLLNGFFMGLGSGAAVIVSQFYGASDRQGVDQALHTGMALSLLMGLTITLLGLTTSPWLLRVTNTPDSCFEGARIYLTIYFTGAIANMIYNMGSGILRAMGNSRDPMLFLIAACLVNIVLDLLLVVHWQMGIAGAAIATVISQVISAVLVVLSLKKLPAEYQFHLRKTKLRANLLRNILLIGVPAGLQFITFDLANLLIQSGINSFGDVTIAAWIAYVKADGITWMVISAFGVSVTTFVGQNFGAGNYRRIRQSVWTCMAMSVTLVGIITALLVTFRVFLLGIYSSDREVVTLGAQIMLWIVPFDFIFVPVEVFAGTMRGTGYSVMPTVITCLCICVFRVIWLYTVVSRWHTVRMLALAYPVSWVLATSVFFIAYRRGTWLAKPIRQSGMEPEIR